MKDQRPPLAWPDLVILDRDGVINHDSKHYIKSADEWQPIAGSLEAITTLSNAGVKVGIATNQRGISLGLYGYPELEAMHAKMAALLATLGGRVDAIEFCIADDEAHPDRKPNPGMLFKIMTALQMPENAVIYFVGDKSSDVMAANNAGVIPILVRSGNGANTEAKLQDDALYVFDDLQSFTAALMAQR